MSANFVVDLGSTVDMAASVTVGSGSDLTVGRVVDLLFANTATQVWVQGGVAGGSGVIEVRIQTSDATTSGSFTDPTSGLAQLPGKVASGGCFFTNSGLYSSGIGSPSAPVDSAPLFCSGGLDFTYFQRPQRYARLILNSGVYPGAISAGFLAQKKVVGSGAGFTYSPTSGTVNV
jgi:predicted RecA/RadA family phage recombinase